MANAPSNTGTPSFFQAPTQPVGRNPILNDLGVSGGGPPGARPATLPQCGCQQAGPSGVKPGDLSNGLVDPQARGTYVSETLSLGMIQTQHITAWDDTGEKFEYSSEGAGISAPGITASAGRWQAFSHADGTPGTADDVFLGSGLSVSRGYGEGGYSSGGVTAGAGYGLTPVGGLPVGVMGTITTRSDTTTNPEDLIGDDFKMPKPQAERLPRTPYD